MKNIQKVVIVILLLTPFLNATETVLKLDTKRHTERIKDITVSKSGDIISASNDKTIRIWDSKSGKEKRKILGESSVDNKGIIDSMALSPNESFLVSGGSFVGDKEFQTNPHENIRIYDYKTGKLLKVLKSHMDVVLDLSFSPDGKFLISGSADNTAKIWRVKDFTLVDTIKFHTDAIYAVKIIQKQNKYFAVTAGYDNQIALYDMQNHKIVKSDKKIYKLKFLASSKNHIAVCGYDSNEITIYDYNLTTIKIINSETKPFGIDYSPNEELLIAGTSNYPLHVNIYSVPKKYQKIQSFKKHTGITTSITFFDDSTVISAGENKEIYMWDIKSGEILKKIEGVGNTVWSVGVKGDTIAWGNSEKNIVNRYNNNKIINLKNLQISVKDTEFKGVPTTYKNYSLSSRIGGEYKMDNAILDIKKDDKIVVSIMRDSTTGYRHSCYGFYKNYIISGGSTGEFKIYNLQGEEVVELIGHTEDIWSIAIDGDKLVSGSSDQTIKIWDLSKLEAKSKEGKVNYDIINKYQKIVEKKIGEKWTIFEIANELDKQGVNYYLTPRIKAKLTLFITKDNKAIAWTSQGFYNASKGAEQYIGFHLNHGEEHEAEFLNVGVFKKQLYRPNIITKVFNGEDVSKFNKEITIEKLFRIKEKR